jgi:putative SOS response-associated peptidase YedK
MCGRFSSFDDEEDQKTQELIKEAELGFAELSLPCRLKTRGEVFPTDTVPVLAARAEGEGGVKAPLKGVAMYWGFPGFPDRKRPSAKPRPLINAKAETAMELKTWRDSARLRRLAVPTSGFYEWSHSAGKAKTKYLFTQSGSKSLFLGGVYKDFPEPGGAHFGHFSIITVAANESMSEIHNRMPLVLEPEDFPLWFKDSQDFTAILNRNSIQLARKPD